MADKKATLWLQLKDDISNGLLKVGTNFDKLANNLRKGGIVFGAIAAGIGFVGSAMITASGKMEQWTISFETMLGSAEKAQLLMTQIREFAVKTPFELPGLVMAAKQLLAVGFSAREIIPTLKAVGDVAAGLSIPIDRLILNLGQVKTQGKLTGRELRDFAVAGVPVLAELAKNMFNVAEASGAQKKQIADMVSKGKIGFEQVAEAFQTMAGEGGTFYDLMDKQSKSFLGIVSNINDEIFQMAEGFGKFLLPSAKKVALIIADLVGTLKALSTPVKIAIIVVAGLTFAFTGLLAGAAAFIVIAPTLAAAWAVAAGPIGLATLAVIGLSTALVGLSMLEKNLISVNNELFKTKKILDALRRNEQQDTERYKKAAQKYSNLTKAKLRLEKEFQKQKSEIVKGDVGEDNKTEEIDQKELDKLKAKVEERLEIARNSEEQLANIKTNAMADELIAKGEHDLAIQLLELQHNENLVNQNKKRTLEEKKQNKLRAGNFKSSLAFIASMSGSHNKTLAAIGKASAISMATIDTYSGIGKAWALGPIVGPPMAALVAAAGFANVAAISGVKLAQGGIVMPTHGGTSAIIGEAGKSEAVIPLEDEATKEKLQDTLGGGDKIIFEIGTLVASDDGLDALAEKMDEKLFELGRNRGSVQ